MKGLVLIVLAIIATLIPLGQALLPVNTPQMFTTYRFESFHLKKNRKSPGQNGQDFFYGRGERIRTFDLSVPNAARLPTAPHPGAASVYQLATFNSQPLCLPWPLLGNGPGFIGEQIVYYVRFKLFIAVLNGFFDKVVGKNWIFR